MASAYAALLSLFHTLNHIKIHPSPPISLHQSQMDSLTQNINFLLDFLECYSGEDNDELESRIAAAAYAAEDVIETHIVNQIHARSNIPQGLGRVMDLMKKKGMKIMGLHHSGSTTSDGGGNISYTDLYGDVERVIHDMDLIKTDVMEIIQQNIMRPQHLHTSFSSVSTASTSQSSTTPVFDDDIIIQLLDKLVGQQSSLQIVPIVGMGGIGKTTLAKYIFEKPLILQHFDTLAWVTISQEYTRTNILLLLCQEVKVTKNVSSEMSEDEIGLVLYQHLFDRRYFIVLDDMWSVEAWYKIKSYFRDNNNGSRIMITTRMLSLAFKLSGSHVFRMNFLDEDKSWGLLCHIVFGKGLGCPIELEKIGREIARNCRGLPLSIVVIGGHLKKSNGTRAHWEYTLQNLSSLISLEDGEFCLRILQTSYKELPMHLKPCFLYMGIFREDCKIRITKLIQLWVAEGILRPTKGKILEEVGEEYINDLIDRNLILVDRLRWNGKVKVCKIHDLLRYVCLREAQKQRFLYVLKHPGDLNIPECMNMERRICIHHKEEKILFALESASLTRSLVSTIGWPELVESHSSRLLRVYMGDNDFHSGVGSVEAIFKKMNLRFLTIVLRVPQFSKSRFPCSWFQLWNLQTLKVIIPSSWWTIMAPSKIWEMPLLRHVVINHLELADPICGENDLILEYLQTLCVTNLKCSRAVIKRIPNIKTLKLLFYGKSAQNHDMGLNNIGHLKNLQSLHLSVQPNMMLNLSFPDSLKKLSLHDTGLNWEECATKIGSLPLLQYLKLDRNAFSGTEWETVEGGFCSLKVLKLKCHTLRYWRTEDTHFPCLELLELQSLEELEEIPSSIGDISTLKSIQLYGCSESAEDSANRIKEEQLELGNMNLQIHISEKTVKIWRYLDEVNETLKYQPEKYYRFFDVMSDYRGNRIDIDGLIREMKVLFKGYPSLIPGFNSLYVPKGYDEITLSDVEEDYASSLLSRWSSWFFYHLVQNPWLFIFIIMFLAACTNFFLHNRYNCM